MLSVNVRIGHYYNLVISQFRQVNILTYVNPNAVITGESLSFP